MRPGARAALDGTRARAARRERAESRVPKHLLYEKGWPKVMPTYEEAVMLCEVRREVAEAVGIAVGYLQPHDVIARYAELMAENAARAA